MLQRVQAILEASAQALALLARTLEQGGPARGGDILARAGLSAPEPRKPVSPEPLPFIKPQSAREGR